MDPSGVSAASVPSDSPTANGVAVTATSVPRSGARNVPPASATKTGFAKPKLSIITSISPTFRTVTAPETGQPMATSPSAVGSGRAASSGPKPVPVSGTIVTAAPGSLLVITRLASAAPDPSGVKLSSTNSPSSGPSAKVDIAREKLPSPPVRLSSTSRSARPSLLTCTSRSSVAPGAIAPKSMAAGLSTSSGTPVRCVRGAGLAPSEVQAPENSRNASIDREHSRGVGDASGLVSFVYQTRIHDGSAISMKYP